MESINILHIQDMHFLYNIFNTANMLPCPEIQYKWTICSHRALSWKVIRVIGVIIGQVGIGIIMLLDLNLNLALASSLAIV